MKRRDLTTSFAAGIGVGSLGVVAVRDLFDEFSLSTGKSVEQSSTGRSFEPDEDAPGKFILVANITKRHRPSDWVSPVGPEDEIHVGDRLSFLVTIGNAGGAPVHGEVVFAFESPNYPTTTKTVTVPKSNSVQSGNRRNYNVGPFTVNRAGEWSFTATDGVATVHSRYDETVSVESRGN
jgi:hypothetical protein